MHLYIYCNIVYSFMHIHLCFFNYVFFYTYLYLMQYNLLIYAYSFMLTDTYCKTVFSFTLTCLFVCVEVLRPSQPYGATLNTVSLPNHTFTGQA